MRLFQREDPIKKEDLDVILDSCNELSHLVIGKRERDRTKIARAIGKIKTKVTELKERL